eukprot:m.20882 g.20882  ORF g.20882 m.20882 type:complete len:194 (-) comp13167_c0_seq1:258-839(-)
MCDDISCFDDYMSSIETYQYVSWGALGLTLVCIVIAVRARSVQTLESIRVLAGMLMMLGGAKIVLGILLLTVFKPTCSCDSYCCDDGAVFLYYPYICFVLGACWITRGIALRKNFALIMLRRQQGNAERTLLITPGAQQQVLIVQNQQPQQVQQQQAVPPPYEAQYQQQQQQPPQYQQLQQPKSEQDEPGRVN